MVNKSGIHPLGRAVLVKPYTPEIKRGLIELPPEVLSRTIQLDQRAIVIEIGPMAWRDELPRAKFGDKVMVSKFAGALIVGPKDGEQYRIVNDNDIFASIEENENE